MSDIKNRVLFLCIHNSARSQMAESFLNHLGEDKYYAESAGIEAGSLNQIVVKVMMDVGYDLSKNKTKSVYDIYKTGKTYDYIITLCDQEAAERCPLFPGKVKHLHRGFKDPSSLNGSKADIIAETIKIRDQIKSKIENFIINGD